MKKFKNAFTLVELMVVVAIIAVLATIVFVNLSDSQDRSDEAKVIDDLNTIKQAVVMLADDTGYYPGYEDNMLSHHKAASCHKVDNKINVSDSRAGLYTQDPNLNYPNWAGPYLSKAMKDPWGNEYSWDGDYLCNCKNNSNNNSCPTTSYTPKGCEGLPDNTMLPALMSPGKNQDAGESYSSDVIVSTICKP